MPMGKFQGQTMAATPSGSLTERNCLPGACEAYTSPAGRLHSSAKKWKNAAAKPTWRTRQYQVELLEGGDTHLTLGLPPGLALLPGEYGPQLLLLGQQQVADPPQDRCSLLGCGLAPRLEGSRGLESRVNTRVMSPCCLTSVMAASTSSSPQSATRLTKAPLYGFTTSKVSLGKH